MNVRYRRAAAADRALVVALLGELIDELGPTDGATQIKGRLDSDIGAALLSARICIVIAETDTETIGLSRGDILVGDPIFRLRDDPRCGYVDQMYVRQAWRRHGIGKELLRHCESWFREQGVAHILLHAAPKAVRFYAREGYQPNREMFKRL